MRRSKLELECSVVGVSEATKSFLSSYIETLTPF